MKKKVTMPKELRLVVKVKAKPGYQIECTFDNDVVKSYDMSFVTKKSGSMLVPFKNESFFKKVFLEMGTPTWPNGYDICPDFLYLEGQVVSSKSKAS